MFASSVVNIGYSCPVKLVSTISRLEVNVLNANTPLHNLTFKHMFSPFAQRAINSKNPFAASRVAFRCPCKFLVFIEVPRFNN